MKRVLNRCAGALIAVLTVLLSWTCRRRKLEDSRPALRRDGRPYVLAGLHAHQAAMVFFNDEPKLAAVVSRSSDGDLLAPALRARGVVPVRGSSAKNGRDKGGARALVSMIRHVREGSVGIITVDGPRGPRGTVQPGIAMLARKTGALIVPVVLIPRFRTILSRTWDRMQLPLPFARLDYAFGEPIDPSEYPGGELTDALESALRTLEEKYDPSEAPRHALS